MLTFPAGEFCAFPVEGILLDGTKVHEEHGIVFSTGPISATITNLDTGASATYNASGATFVDGTLAGASLIGQPKSRNVGDPLLIIIRGRVTFTENNTIDTSTGKRIDICAELT